MRYGEGPQPSMCAGAQAHHVMHASVRIGDVELLMSDGQCSGQPAVFQGFSLTLNVADTSQAERTVAALSDGGTLTVPLMATFFSPAFGVVQDRFGLSWMVVAEQPAAA